MQELRRIREREGLSRAALAAKSGLNPATVNRIEAGERSPTVATLEKLAAALEVEMSEFFPKAQAKLWSSLSPEWRPNHDFAAARQKVQEFCEHWDGKLSGPDLDYRSLKELGTVLDAWLDVFEIALDAELYELNTSRASEVDWESMFTQPHGASELMRVFDEHLIPLIEKAARLEGEEFDCEAEEAEITADRARESIKERNRRIA